ncbi:MAG: hypothetical protein KAT58_09970 [candidate division Zixibacteria bacterium]|nr:hypothetical protein [candidate division Zixibacteria bacterium]
MAMHVGFEVPEFRNLTMPEWCGEVLRQIESNLPTTEFADRQLAAQFGAFRNRSLRESAISIISKDWHDLNGALVNAPYKSRLTCQDLVGSYTGMASLSGGEVYRFWLALRDLIGRACDF